MRRTAVSGVRRVAPLNGAVASDIGSVREENQDRVALVRGCDRSGAPFILAALADGIGGMKSGAECAAVTLGTFISSIVTDAQFSPDPREWLSRGAQRANQTVHARHVGSGGATLVATLLAKGHPPLWLSIGDSRVYQAFDGKLRQLSRDDTLEGQLGKASGGRSHDLLQFVGIGDALEPHIEVISSEGGTLLLTTDGVHFIDSDYLAKVVQHASDLGLCVRRLTELAKMVGGPDNASVAALSLDALAADVDPHLDGSYEVWDPFGELQVFFDRGSRRYGSVSPQRDPEVKQPKPPDATDVEPDASHDKNLSTSVPNLPAGKQSNPKTKLQPKKSRGARKKPKGPSTDVEERQGADVPQLLIEFPNKTP